MSNTQNSSELNNMLSQRPRPTVAKLCRATYVLPDSSHVHTFMPWIDDVRRLSGKGLTRAMLTEAILNGGQYGCRNIYCVAFWREPRVAEVFDRAQLLTLCRKWARRKPYEVLSDYHRMARAFGRYTMPNGASHEELAAAGAADAAKVMAVAALNMDDVLHEDHMEILLGVRLSVNQLVTAALRCSYGMASWVLRGYTLAQNLSTTSRKLLLDKVASELANGHVCTAYAACAYRWLLDGITRATGNCNYANVPGLRQLQQAMCKAGWQFLPALHGNNGMYVSAVFAGGDTMRLKVLSTSPDEHIVEGDEVMVHYSQLRYAMADGCAYMNVCRPPSPRAKTDVRRTGNLVF